jgi:hypothetical protein
MKVKRGGEVEPKLVGGDGRDVGDPRSVGLGDGELAVESVGSDGGRRPRIVATAAEAFVQSIENESASARDTNPPPA